MEQNLNKINTREFIEKNLDFIISYDDEKSNTRLIKYKNFIEIFREEIGMNGLSESINNDPMSTYFGYSMFCRYYNCKKINNIKDATINGISSDFLFNNNFILSALLLIDINEFHYPPDLTEFIKKKYIESKKNTKRGCFIIILFILIVAGIIFYLS